VIFKKKLHKEQIVKRIVIFHFKKPDCYSCVQTLEIIVWA